MLVVADDLSGAVEVAAVLGARRIALGHADGDVIDLDTRALAAGRGGAPDPRARRPDHVQEDRLAAARERRGRARGAVRRADRRARAAGRGPDRAQRRPARARRPAADADRACSTPRPTRTSTRSSPPRRRTRRSSARPASRPRSAAGSERRPLPRPTPRDGPLLVGVGTRAADEQCEAAPRDVEVIRGTAERGRAPASPRRRAADLVLTGGETARRTLDALGVTTLEPIAQIHHGAVQCRTPGRPPRHHPPRQLRRSGQPA